ncbi:hypothetical protein GCM10023340_04170 [Nocardioides marinquilinus]|uniref:Oligosaccharide repeat unit polymerase n=1 Tax=Nocardioides marinquilinus TaxID=1210400 RepID=A0ABP9P7I1_9ACTN
MTLSAAGVVVTCLLAVLIIVVGGSMVRSATDVVLVYLLVFCQFYGLRPVLFVLGLDRPAPEQQFFASDTTGVLATTTLGVVVFLGATLAGTALWWSSGLPGWGPCFGRHDVSLDRLLKVSLWLTAGAVVVSAVLLARHGGVGGLIAAAKFDKALAGLFVLRMLPSIGAVVSVATFLEAAGRPGRRTVAALGLACAVVDAFAVFLWGSRSVLVVIAATVILGLRRRRSESSAPTPAAGSRSSRPRGAVVVRLALAVVLVVATAGTLRIVRDDLTQGEVLDVYAEAGPARQMSLATNATYFDAAMLAFRDWPAHNEPRAGEDFVTGFVALVPRLVWADKPDAIAPGRWFRQHYQPEKVNGWPMGAAGLWYLNFGWVGLLLGGLLSGLLLGAVAKEQRRRPDHGYNRAVAVMVGVFVLGLGWDSDSVVRIVIWVVPLWLVARYVSPRPAARAPSDPQIPYLRHETQHPAHPQ